MGVELSRLDSLLRASIDRLLASRTPDGHWEGRLSASALATATAVIALAQLARETDAPGEPPVHATLVERGLDWLVAHQRADGGWGDTPASPSNVSTTALGWAAFGAARRDRPGDRHAAAAAERWLERAAGGVEASRLVAALVARYGRDRTFSAPILMSCAIAGRLGSDGWRWVPQLPFEIAALPHRWFPHLRLPVVSYALPALIAIGQARHAARPSGNPLARAARALAREPTRRVLGEIQPSSGGYLEAVPLTSFVIMGLVASGRPRDPVAARGAAFLARTVRADGSWPIDSNLATWVTTLAVNALAAGSRLAELMPSDARARVRDWLLAQQHRVEHPHTHAGGGGWAWTDLAGGVPDADDTAGALVALHNLDARDPHVADAARAGLAWLLDLQNRDGGVPTFCRGWGTLPFDCSGPDLTAHALVPWTRWRAACPPAQAARIARATTAALRYLAATQRAGGAWVPLWFGNQAAPGEENQTYGTARVAIALRASAATGHDEAARLARAGEAWLEAAQNEDGGWGGAPGVASTIEETALALAALASADAAGRDERRQAAIARGVGWLADRTDEGRAFPPAPIGLYFARLWYDEALYPLVFTVGALERVRATLVPSRGGG